MEEWEIESKLAEKELPGFEDKLRQAVFLTKFVAITAKKFLLASKVTGVEAKDLIEGVNEWVDKLGNEVKENEEIR